MKYIKESFEDLVKKSNNYNHNKYVADNRWIVLKSLYEKNYLLSEDNSIKIPKIIHQIWVGNKPLPKDYLFYIDTWKKINPDWKHILWTDKDINNINFINRNLYNRIKNNGQKSDYLRYCILNEYGGLYVDTDFECLKSFNDLCYLDFYTSTAYSANLELYIGIIGSTPNHPIIKKCVDNINNNGVSENNWKEIFDTTGTYFFTKTFFDVVNENTKDVVVFPVDYFYPFSNGYRSNLDRNFRLSHVKEFSYAIHHWGVSWLK